MRLPGNAVEFFTQILKIAMLEVLPIGMLYDKHFHFTKTDPINLNFEAVGFESTNFLKNIGSMILPIVFSSIDHVELIPSDAGNDSNRLKMDSETKMQSKSSSELNSTLNLVSIIGSMLIFDKTNILIRRPKFCVRCFSFSTLMSVPVYVNA